MNVLDRVLLAGIGLVVLSGCQPMHFPKAEASTAPQGAEVEVYAHGDVIATCHTVDGETLTGCAVTPGHTLDDVMSVVLHQLQKARQETKDAEDAPAPDCSAIKTRFHAVRM